MRLAFFGDVVGRSGREGLASHLPGLRRRLGLEFVAVNAENAAAGFGITENTAKELFAAGADCLTLGNHSWDQKEALTYIVREPRLIRPLNYPAFAAAAGDAIIVDMHAEATSEKMAMGHFCDGRASLVVGTHTHVPTADGQILSGGTAYQTDAGACADYDSVIGNQKEEPIRRFTTRISQGRFKPAEGVATVCGLYLETDDATGLARRLEPIRIGGRLSQTVPQVETIRV